MSVPSPLWIVTLAPGCNANLLKTYVARRLLSVHPPIATGISPRFCKVAHSPFSDAALTRILVNRTSGSVGPVDPVGPDSPVGPVGPVNPVGPVGPVNPVGPVTPVDLVDPVAASEAARQNAKETTRTPANLFNLALSEKRRTTGARDRRLP